MANILKSVGIMLCSVVASYIPSSRDANGNAFTTALISVMLKQHLSSPASFCQCVHFFNISAVTGSIYVDYAVADSASE